MIASQLAFLWVLALLQVAHAQFNFFDQMFGGHGHGGHGHSQQQQPQNVASDSSWYRSNVESMHCDKYLCPDTLACVTFPHHCPCQFPSVEDKVELADGQRVCVSRGGFKDGEAARKIELARKGML